MKLTAIFLISFILASFGATCSDGCEDEHNLEEYEWVWHEAEDHEVDFCTPFCGCNCCQTISLEHKAWQYQEVKPYRPAATFSPDQPPAPRGHDIWQPPKY